MDYFSVVFALSLGFLFALMAYNKTGEVAPPVLGGFVCIVFWLLFNEVVGNVCGVFEFSPSWSNENLWTEACITSFVGAVFGIENTYKPKTKKKGILRFFVPLFLAAVSMML